MASRQGWIRGVGITLVSLASLGSLAYLTILALQGSRLVKINVPVTGPTVQFHNPRPWLISALVAAVLTLVGWCRAEWKLRSLERGREALVKSEREARERKKQMQERLADSEQERQRLEQENGEQTAQREKLMRGWRAEREWNRELREQIVRMQHQHGILGRFDVREMVLQLTVELVEAEKGILLSRGNETSDGQKEVVCAIGFENDPQESALAQRFANEVIEQGTTIREDDRSGVDAGKRSAADEEVQNILAIPIYLSNDFHGVIVCANRKEGFASIEDDVLVAVGDHAGAVLENSRLHGELRNAYLGTVRMLADVIEVKDPDLRGHSEAVSEYVMAVADRLQFEPRRREELLFGSLLHDVGKLGISERILLKPGPLTDEERSVMQLHSRIGYHLIRQIPALASIAPAVLHHHERYDGEGYPGRLRADAIPIEARIIAVADAFSAMTVQRPYSAPRTIDEACAELERCAGEQFDPQVVRLFVEEVRRRPPDELEPDRPSPDPEIELHRDDGSFVLGGRSFGITDSLTLLYSHRHFHETAHAEAQRAILQQRPFAIVICHLADLHTLNHSRGYDSGDRALQRAADAFRETAAQVEGLAFRVSGSRIGLLASGLDSDHAARLVDELGTELSPHLGVRIGAAAWREGESGEQVIERALRSLADPQVPSLRPSAAAG